MTPRRRPPTSRLPFPSNSAGKGNLIGRALREAPVPGEAEAEGRGLEVVLAAYAERQPRRHRTSLPRLALAFAIAVLLAALLLSPAGATVRDWVDDAFSGRTAPAPTSLADLPGGGRLLVQGGDGPWVVQPDGARRRLGDYDEATWSPHGLFVAVAAGRELTAVEPDGTPRWSLTATGSVRDPRWGPSGVLIAYRAGPGLRVVAGDGTEDRAVAARVAPLAAAWDPLGWPQLAYVSAGGELRVANVERGTQVAAKRPALPGVRVLEWGERGQVLLEASATALRLRPIRVSKLEARMTIGPGEHLPLPPGGRLLDAALSPDGRTVAATVRVRGARGPRTSVLLFDTANERRRRLGEVPGALPEITWSPDGRRLLVAWPDFDQWLFLPLDGRRQGRSLTGVAAAFAPGAVDPAFPRVEGWCCRALPNDGG